MPGGQINVNDPSSGKLFSLPFLTANSLISVSDLGLALCYASVIKEIQGNHQVCRAEVPGQRQEILTQTLIVCL